MLVALCRVFAVIQYIGAGDLACFGSSRSEEVGLDCFVALPPQFVDPEGSEWRNARDGRDGGRSHSQLRIDSRRREAGVSSAPFHFSRDERGAGELFPNGRIPRHMVTTRYLAIRHEEESSERKEHIAARSWLELLREHRAKIGDELLTIRLAGKGIEPGPQAGATVPLDDFIDARQEMKVLGRPDVQLTYVRREDIVVKLSRMHVPLTRSARESILPGR
jgi:hypothetical protein